MITIHNVNIPKHVFNFQESICCNALDEDDGLIRYRSRQVLPMKEHLERQIIIILCCPVIMVSLSVNGVSVQESSTELSKLSYSIKVVVGNYVCKYLLQYFVLNFLKYMWSLNFGEMMCPSSNQVQCLLYSQKLILELLVYILTRGCGHFFSRYNVFIF